ncbi:MAG: hypothetical protein HY543_02420, partial [Deltaproteobacteria bacterium]|nr:hypothetical protein [Deltaproteobacteria bacterium]
MKIAIAQINTTVGDIEGNTERILAHIAGAKRQGAALCLFPELAVPGYPPRDLLEIPSFIAANEAAMRRVAKAARGIGVICGYVSRNRAKIGRPLYNTAALLVEGAVRHLQHKTLLPNYDVFDEVRHVGGNTRQINPKCRTLARRARHGDVAAALLHDAVD